VTPEGQGAWSPTAYAMNRDVRIAYDCLLGSSGDPLLLVMGLGTSRFWWPLGLCEAFAAQGFQVVRYDQRDAGESTRMPDTSAPNPFASLMGRKSESYSADDMADDAVAVLDSLGWERAHIFGHSMGGTLAQRIALRHPERVLPIVSSAVPSDASGLSVFRYLRFGLLARLARAKFPEGREGDIEASLAVARGVASRTYPFDEDAARERIERQVDSGPRDTKAQSRQIGAKWHGPNLRSMVVRALVLAGMRTRSSR
jgi:pimeloyl-ACP methyl ester carboxylesterase